MGHNGGGPKSRKWVADEALKDGRIQQWAEKGLTDKQIASKLGISLRSLYEYKAQDPQLAHAIIRARLATPTDEAWNGLIRLSTGYHEKTTRRHVKIRKDAKGNIIGRDEEVIEEDNYIPPQASACKSVLANFYNQARRGGGFPEDYIAEPVPIQQQDKAGRLAEMDAALKEIFFGGRDESD